MRKPVINQKTLDAIRAAQKARRSAAAREGYAKRILIEQIMKAAKGYFFSAQFKNRVALLTEQPCERVFQNRRGDTIARIPSTTRTHDLPSGEEWEGLTEDGRVIVRIYIAMVANPLKDYTLTDLLYILDVVKKPKNWQIPPHVRLWDALLKHPGRADHIAHQVEMVEWSAKDDAQDDQYTVDSAAAMMESSCHGWADLLRGIDLDEIDWLDFYQYVAVQTNAQ